MPEALTALEKLRADQHRLLLRAGWQKLDTEVVTMGHRDGKVSITYWRKNGREFPQHYALFLERHGWRG